MYQEIIYSSIRILVAYFFLLFITRLMSRKMISQMTFFDFVVGVTVGSVASNLTVNTNNPVTSGITVLTVLTIIVLIIDFVNIKSFYLRKIINSEPVVVIEKGKIINENLKKVRLTVDSLMMLLREKSAFNISDVESAVFETNGKLSVLKKSPKQPVTPSDLNVSTKYGGLTKDVIIDGNIMVENLTAANLNKDWLIQKLKANNIKKVEEVFYAGLDSSGNLYISTKKISKEKEGKHGIE